MVDTAANTRKPSAIPVAICSGRLTSSSPDASAGADVRRAFVTGRARAMVRPTRTWDGTLRVLNGGVTDTNPAIRATASTKADRVDSLRASCSPLTPACPSRLPDRRQHRGHHHGVGGDDVLAVLALIETGLDPDEADEPAVVVQRLQQGIGVPSAGGADTDRSRVLHLLDHAGLVVPVDLSAVHGGVGGEVRGVPRGLVGAGDLARLHAPAGGTQGV